MDVHDQLMQALHGVCRCAWLATLCMHCMNVQNCKLMGQHAQRKQAGKTKAVHVLGEEMVHVPKGTRPR